MKPSFAQSEHWKPPNCSRHFTVKFIKLSRVFSLWEAQLTNNQTQLACYRLHKQIISYLYCYAFCEFIFCSDTNLHPFWADNCFPLFVFFWLSNHDSVHVKVELWFHWKPFKYLVSSSMRRGGLMVSALDSGTSGLGSSPDRGRWFPFHKRSMSFLTVDAIIGNQAFQNERFHISFSLGLDKVETGVICWWSKMHSPNG